MRRNDRARRRVLALSLAAVVHAALFAGLILGRQPIERFVDNPAIQVTLIEPPRREESTPAPKPRPVPVRPPPPEAVPPPSSLPAPPPAETEAAIDPRWRVKPPGPGEATATGRAAYGVGRQARRPLHERCYDDIIAEADREACKRLTALKPPIGHPEDDTGAFTQAARRKAAISAYRRSYRGDDHPGLQCSFGRACNPYTPPTQPDRAAPVMR